MKNKEYWARRYLLDKAGHVNTGEDFLKDTIAPLYQEAIKEIEEDIEKFYRTFSDQENISLAEARKQLRQLDFEAINFEGLARQQAAKQKEYAGLLAQLPGDVVAAMEKEHEAYKRLLAAYTKKGSISRLEQLHMEIEKSLYELYDKDQMHIYDFLQEQYVDSYYKSVFKGQQAVGFGKDFAAPNQKAIEQAVLHSYKKDNYSTIIWEHRAHLSEDLRENLTVGLIRGESLSKMATRIKRRMEVSRSNAYRLVRTESAYIYEQATRKAYEECGIEKYEFLATLDMRTSDICQELDGKVYHLKDARPGKNYPPMHPNCRSTTVAAFEDDVVTVRIAKDENGKYYEVPSNMTYKQWYKKYVVPNEKDDIIKLTKAQQYALNDYLGFGSYGINNKLLSGDALTPAEKRKVKALNNALDKFPVYEGQLTRSLYFYDDEAKNRFIEQHQPGKIITYNAFTSTTKDKEFYNPDGQVQVIISNAKQGKDISKVNRQEQEVLYKAGHSFKIINTTDIDGVTYIVMEEL